MLRRIAALVTLALGLAVAVVFAVRNGYAASALPIAARIGGVRLLFDSATWLVWAAPFAGLIAAGFTPRRDPVIEGDRVLRHDTAAIVEHWSHAAATVILLISGFALGVRYLLPRFVSGATEAGVTLNLHFVGAVIFGFGATFYTANAVLSGRWREHIPHAVLPAIKDFFRHYRAIFTRSELPPEGKYFAIEHLTYPIAILGSALIFITGLVKVAAHTFGLPAGLMGATTLVHDLAAIVLGFFLIAHAVAGALVPWSWPLLRSMLTGYVTLDYAKHHHKLWYDELSTAEKSEKRPAA